MRVDDFDYNLPSRLIAQVPIEPRDSSRLFVVPLDGGAFRHLHFRNLPELLDPGDVLVVNDTRVRPARLFGRRHDSGGQVEFLLLRPIEDDRWEVLARPGKRVRVGHQIDFGDGQLAAVVVGTTDFGGRVVRFRSTLPLEDAFAMLGKVPLPPYVKARLKDPERYQTVYSAETGSAAAPTAGLHFTPELIDTLRQKGVGFCRLTLHVGLGTFRPVSVERVEEHRMHPEFYHVSPEAADAVNRARAAGRRVVAVGTTSVRTLETVADANGCLHAGSGWTDIFIYPGYRIKAFDAMVTNFHLPRSTLLMLVSALVGRDRLMEAYREAIDMEYRFYSFGDAMIII